ncbi:SRPBCC family protein [Thermasporomyces composti]|jgi:uncharacterized protein YndB with AHSA1/START domain|uniref:Uncharacterized protein YndB with AHSA1/START domain n=1 Tax=Thermasporomyces composti TaxID=696763 RepID=A0A3D9V8V3_THECX|nr:SRPBCC family protein [Thermasporomyces composti]REF35425.1 uncharacterized protein YndB with AHSA1/START domain [Thermasporomyces composti]
MIASTKHETHIDVDPQLPTIRVTREFDAPAERVFRAHVEPELFAQWVGPASASTRIDHWDARTGGSYRFVNIEGEQEYAFYGSFHEVRPHERVVQTFTYEGMPDMVSLEFATFEDLGDGRSRLETLSVLDSIEARDQMIASGMEAGVVEGYAMLDALLARQ